MKLSVVARVSLVLNSVPHLRICDAVGNKNLLRLAFLAVAAAERGVGFLSKSRLIHRHRKNRRVFCACPEASKRAPVQRRAQLN